MVAVGASQFRTEPVARQDCKGMGVESGKDAARGFLGRRWVGFLAWGLMDCVVTFRGL